MELINNKIDLTIEAKSIFGDIVEYAYLFKPPWSDNFSLDKIDADLISIEPVDAYPVFVKLLNGKSFKLWSSEWGGVVSITEETHLKEL